MTTPGVYSDMAISIGHQFGMVTVFVSLLMTRNALNSEYSDQTGATVLLPHRCTDQELMNRGDGREIFVRYRIDHSSFVNSELMPVEDDLRREILGIMSTRREKVITFMADERLTYREVSDVLSNLQGDESDLSILLATKNQESSGEQQDAHPFDILCMDWHEARASQ